MKLTKPKSTGYKFPLHIEQATANPGASWPHVLANSLSGGQPINRLVLPPKPSAVGNSESIWIFVIVSILVLCAVL